MNLPGKKLNKCGDCEKAFKEEQGLKDHIRVNCPECDNHLYQSQL